MSEIISKDLVLFKICSSVQQTEEELLKCSRPCCAMPRQPHHAELHHQDGIYALMMMMQADRLSWCLMFWRMFARTRSRFVLKVSEILLKPQTSASSLSVYLGCFCFSFFFMSDSPLAVCGPCVSLVVCVRQVWPTTLCTLIPPFILKKSTDFPLQLHS